MKDINWIKKWRGKSQKGGGGRMNNMTYNEYCAGICDALEKLESIIVPWSILHHEPDWQLISFECCCHVVAVDDIQNKKVIIFLRFKVCVCTT